MGLGETISKGVEKAASSVGATKVVAERPKVKAIFDRVRDNARRRASGVRLGEPPASPETRTSVNTQAEAPLPQTETLEQRTLKIPSVNQAFNIAFDKFKRDYQEQNLQGILSPEAEQAARVQAQEYALGVAKEWGYLTDPSENIPESLTTTDFQTLRHRIDDAELRMTNSNNPAERQAYADLRNSFNSITMGGLTRGASIRPDDRAMFVRVTRKLKKIEQPAQPAPQVPIASEQRTSTTEAQRQNQVETTPFQGETATETIKRTAENFFLKDFTGIIQRYQQLQRESAGNPSLAQEAERLRNYITLLNDAQFSLNPTEREAAKAKIAAMAMEAG